MMRRNRILFWLILAVAALVLSLTWLEHVQAPTSAAALTPVLLTGPDGSQKTVFAEVADSDMERQNGLMNRTSLNVSTGMLFVFDQPQELSFWMKNTKIPLDILFFNDEGAFVSRAAMEPCLDDPCSIYPSHGPSLYALEVNFQEPATVNVGPGWKLTVPQIGQ